MRAGLQKVRRELPRNGRLVEAIRRPRRAVALIYDGLRSVAAVAPYPVLINELKLGN